MRELDKEGRSPRYVAFFSLVTLIFLIFIGRFKIVLATHLSGSLSNQSTVFKVTASLAQNRN